MFCGVVSAPCVSCIIGCSWEGEFGASAFVEVSSVDSEGLASFSCSRMCVLKHFTEQLGWLAWRRMEEP